MCSFCDIQNKGIQLNLFDEYEIEKIIASIYRGEISIYSLDLNTYKKVAEKLTSGVYEGFGNNLKTVLYQSEDYKMLYSLRENVYIFSAAKQYQQVRMMSSFLTDGDQIVPFSEFKKQARNVFDEFNVNYLSAEYNSAIAQSRSASQWQDFERTKKTFPYLKYQTAGDGRVRPEHASLNGIVKKVNDPFWSKFMPPNGWNCRCDVIQLDEAEITNTENLVVENVPDEFRFNPGKQKIVFSKKHPYFKVAKQDKDWAKQNFGLPLPGEL